MRFTKHHDAWNTFVDYAAAPPPAGCEAGRTHPTEWNGGTTFDEAIEMGHRGWAEAAPDADRLAQGITRQVLADRESIEWTFPRDVTGDTVDIGAYLSGVPECFITPMPVTTAAPARVVRLVIATGALSTVTADAMRNRGIAVVALIECIRRAGYSVELWAWAAATLHSGRQSHAVLVQGADQPVNTGRIMFAFAHPSMHRRLMFAARHNAEVPASLRWEGYGGTVDGDPDPGDLPDGIVTEDTLVIPAIRPGEAWTTNDSVWFINRMLDRLAG
jgi:hypothetical protein